MPYLLPVSSLDCRKHVRVEEVKLCDVRGGGFSGRRGGSYVLFGYYFVFAVGVFLASVLGAAACLLSFFGGVLLSVSKRYGMYLAGLVADLLDAAIRFGRGFNVLRVSCGCF